MSWHSFRIATSFCLVLTGGAQGLPAQNKPMNVDRAIQLFAGLEREYKVLEWTLQSDRSLLKDAGDLSSVIPFAESPYLVAKVRFDPHSRRYIVETQTVTHWFVAEGAPTAFVAILESRGFDGRVYRSWSQE